MPGRTSPEIERRVLDARGERRRGPDWIGPELGVPARTVTRILRRHHMPRLCECDPLTEQVVRASKTATIRYERDRPGVLIHMDVKSSAGSQTGAAGGPTAKKWDPLASRNELGSDPTTSIQ